MGQTRLWVFIYWSCFGANTYYQVNCYLHPEFLSVLHIALTRPELETFPAIFSTKILASGVVTFSLPHYSNTHSTSVVAGLVSTGETDFLIFLQTIPQLLTGLELIVQKKGGLVSNPWTLGNMKEKKFREVQKAVAEEIHQSLSCNCDITLVPMARQLAWRSNIVYAFSKDRIGDTCTAHNV